MFNRAIWSVQFEHLGRHPFAPLGYVLKGIAEIIGFLGALTVIGASAF